MYGCQCYGQSKDLFLCYLFHSFFLIVFKVTEMNHLELCSLSSGAGSCVGVVVVVVVVVGGGGGLLVNSLCLCRRLR